MMDPGMRERLAARGLGLGLLVLGASLAVVLMFIAVPVGLPVIVAGLLVVTACASVILGYGMRGWGGSAMGFASLAAILLAGFAARSASQSPQLPLEIAADDAHCTVAISGDLTDQLYRRLRSALDEHPQTRAVLLDSAGGSALAITQVARLLRDRGVRTAVMHDQCDSACAFLWASAPRRIIAGPARTLAPGFHAPHIALPGFGTLRAVVQDHQQRAYLESAGLPENFVGWAYAPVESLWRPDAQALGAIGVATEFVSTRFPEKLSFCD
ncbi:MAG TPA: hypothetical protein VFB36_10300, partial [Nevskiaceae bacterium]|nr:hypothetical protein [Nevskiaceae bacterium]